jgi:hypothetical protein
MALFRKTIEPRCAYCRHGATIGENEVACYYKGVMDGSYRCRRFRYDPLRRVPPPPAQLRRDYKPEDFTL